jgi:nucleoporin GLE1
MRNVKEILNSAKNIRGPDVNITEYLVFGHGQGPATLESLNPAFPGVLLFLLNHLAKSSIRQLLAESAVEADAADVVGIFVCTIFAAPEFRWNNTYSLIDILWAKYHRVCPPLFGIFGSESSKQGRERIGWLAKWEGVISNPNDFYQRMTGLGAGYSAITLRDFSKNRNPNPAPNRLWWEAIARILNTPPSGVQQYHYVLLKAMIEHFVPRIMQMFGGAGKALLRKAILDFPKQAPTIQGRGGPTKTSSVLAVESMQVLLQQKYHLTL